MIDWVRGWLLLAVVVAAAVVVAIAPSTTTASAAAFTYDVPAIARVGVHAIGTGEVSQTQLSGMRERSALPSGEGRGASTTPYARNDATEAVVVEARGHG